MFGWTTIKREKPLQKTVQAHEKVCIRASPCKGLLSVVHKRLQSQLSITHLGGYSFFIETHLLFNFGKHAYDISSCTLFATIFSAPWNT